MEHPTYCSFPFESIAPKSWIGGKPHRVTPCCNMKSSITEDPMSVKPLTESGASLTDIFNSPQFEQLRQDLLDGIKNPACEYCWRLESRTGLSPRITAIQDMPDSVMSDVPQLQKLDTMIDENCNLRCRMCAPSTSNSLRQDYNQIVELDLPLPEYYSMKQSESQADPVGNQVFFGMNAAYQKEIIQLGDTMRELKFTGGEPTVSKTFWDIVDSLEHPDRIKIHLTTNATKFNNRFLDSMKEFRERHFTLSIDGTRSTYEYMRYPFNWRKLETNIDKLCETQDPESTEIHICSVLTVYNMLNIRNLVDWIIQHNWHSEHKITWKCIPDPHPLDSCIDVKWTSRKLLHMALQNMSATECDDYVRDSVEKTVKYLEWCISSEQNDELLAERRDRLKQDTTTLDRVREQNYDEMLHPDIADFILNIPSLDQFSRD